MKILKDQEKKQEQLKEYDIEEDCKYFIIIFQLYNNHHHPPLNKVCKIKKKVLA